MSGNSSSPRCEKRLRTVRRHRRIRSDVGVELRPEPRQRFVHLDGGAIAAAFVEHVGGDRGEPFLAMWIGRGAAANEERERHQRHLCVMHGPDPHAVGQRRLLDGGERERARRTQLGKLRAIDLGRARLGKLGGCA